MRAFPREPEGSLPGLKLRGFHLSEIARQSEDRCYVTAKSRSLTPLAKNASGFGMTIFWLGFRARLKPSPDVSEKSPHARSAYGAPGFLQGLKPNFLLAPTWGLEVPTPEDKSEALSG